VFRCVLGSEGCVLVPRSSGTPVATWAWPTWVVSWRRVLEFPSPSRRIFIGSHSLPPLRFAVSVLQTQVGQLAGCLSNDEGKLPGQPKSPESAKAIQTRSGKEAEDPERSAGARKPKPSAEMEGVAKEKVTGVSVLDRQPTKGSTRSR
jgi:hypothetical protein